LSSPLARVAEEPQVLKLDTQIETKPEKLISADTPKASGFSKFDKPAAVDSPINSEGEERRGSLPKSKLNNSMSNEAPTLATPIPITNGDHVAAKPGADDGEAEMKDVQI
jgi:hypothetical protein